MTQILHGMLWGIAIFLFFWWIFLPAFLVTLLGAVCLGSFVSSLASQCVAWLLGEPAPPSRAANKPPHPGRPGSRARDDVPPRRAL